MSYTHGHSQLDTIEYSITMQYSDTSVIQLAAGRYRRYSTGVYMYIQCRIQYTDAVQYTIQYSNTIIVQLAPGEYTYHHHYAMVATACSDYTVLALEIAVTPAKRGLDN